ncbi:VirB3 family type IV secretion system protein [Mitsuokella sp. oral taxon 131]|uniref:VirB3 family type IV secretion system protein n=1 Tax=Mitsuokella sp. oral taxon 131 TaxID=1321780 RepID=UPI0003ADEC11|nr:VirB3 family type IV secretion system protein [Mitsuokella sp. oral taxon 131]ERL03192.1 type IV secretory pathway, VirB3-like protein [Mitsuokella sp. oral taxon 131 str. W9106]
MIDEKDLPANTISWTHLPLYRSLTEYILFMGVPRTFIIANVGAALFVLLTFGISYWYVLLLNFVLHFGVRHLSQDDAQFFECFSNYTYKRDYYST